MKRFVPFLLLLSTTITGLCAEDDWSLNASTQFSAWSDANYTFPGSWLSIQSFGNSTPADSQQTCLDEESLVCTESPASGTYRDRDGLKRDTYHFLVYQVATIGILYVMPESMSGWSDEQKEEYSLSRWWRNVTHPTWDEDDFFINYVTHPYWGAAYFVRARERGYTNRQSFWYSAMLSTMYEFGAEALFEQPSIQDLIVTPVFGSLLGRYFMGVRDNVEYRAIERGYRTTKDKWILALTDPLGAINRTVDRWLGLDADLQLRPYMQVNRRTRDASFGPPVWEEDTEIGVAFSLRW